ncbi:hypothetical protein C8J57DRAFT_1235112 [Mycena rebaudengoi]|nr:hypothetical protein C8J57DRAFT_1235112 [Mycena rebaudengoi]
MVDSAVSVQLAERMNKNSEEHIVNLSWATHHKVKAQNGDSSARSGAIAVIIGLTGPLDTEQLLDALPLPGHKPKQGQTSVMHDKANARDAKTRDAPFSEPTSPRSEASNENVDEDPSYAYSLHKESLSASIRSVSVRSDRHSKPKPTYAESPARHLSSLATTSPERRLSHTLTTPERSPPARRPVWPPAHSRPSTVVSSRIRPRLRLLFSGWACTRGPPPTRTTELPPHGTILLRSSIRVTFHSFSFTPSVVQGSIQFPPTGNAGNKRYHVRICRAANVPEFNVEPMQKSKCANLSVFSTCRASIAECLQPDSVVELRVEAKPRQLAMRTPLTTLEDSVKS